MRLVKCHIDNFGKLCDYTIEFTENPQVFLEPNGWGKSTLASFIKVMFYGFSNERNRGDILSRERVRFKPWQGGTYGGELWFEAGGKTYLLNRTFGSKEAEDTFALYDAQTNLPSNAFGEGANIGENLFQIDQDSFLNTVFIAQNYIQTEMTDGIHAKIGNLSECMGDMKDFENVCQRLKSLTNKLTPKRRPGELKLLKEEISDRKNELRRMDGIAAAVVDIETKIKTAETQKAALILQKQELSEQWEQLGIRNEIRARKEHYDSISQKLKEAERRRSSRLDRFGGELPSMAQVEEMSEKNKELLKTESQYRENLLEAGEEKRFLQLQRRFEKGEPSDKERQQLREGLQRLQSLREQAAGARLSEEEQRELEDLQDRMEKLASVESQPGGLVDAALFKADEFQKLQESLGKEKSVLAAMEQRKQWEEQQQFKLLQQQKQEMEDRQQRAALKRKKLQAGMGLSLTTGVLLLFYSFLSDSFRWLCTGLGVLCLGAAVICLFMIFYTKKEASTASVQEEPMDFSGSKLQNRELSEKTRETEALQKQIEHRKKELLDFVLLYTDYARLYGTDFVLSGVRNCLYQLKADQKRWQAIKKKQEAYRQLNLAEQMQEQLNCIKESLGRYYDLEIAQEQELQQYFDLMEKELLEYKVLKEHYLRAEERKDKGDKLRAELTVFLRQYCQSETEDFSVGIQTILQELTAEEREKKEYDALLGAKEEFENSFDISLFDTLEGQERQLPAQEAAAQDSQDQRERLRESLSTTEQRLQTVTDTIHSYVRQLDEKQEELDLCEQEKEKLQELEEAYLVKEKLYENLMLTEQYLETARESLSAKFVEPMQNTFRKYYELLSGEPSEDFRMDANIQVTRRDMGQQRDVRAFSRGNQDLISLVLRVSLVSAMYQQEKPFLVLDDSFINLDGPRLQTAQSFMKALAEEYQILYFTCHESRRF